MSVSLAAIHKVFVSASWALWGTLKLWSHCKTDMIVLRTVDETHLKITISLGPQGRILQLHRAGSRRDPKTEGIVQRSRCLSRGSMEHMCFASELACLHTCADCCIWSLCVIEPSIFDCSSCYKHHFVCVSSGHSKNTDAKADPCTQARNHNATRFYPCTLCTITPSPTYTCVHQNLFAE